MSQKFPTGLPTQICGPKSRRCRRRHLRCRRRGRPPHPCAGRCRPIIRRRRRQWLLPRCHKPRRLTRRRPHLTCRRRLNRHRHRQLRRWPIRSCHRCRARRCRCRASAWSPCADVGFSGRY
jgi:hypothetical protein